MSAAARYMVFSLSGVQCGGCIANAQEALANVPGVDHIDFDLAGTTVTVAGDADPERVVQALAAAGYPAMLQNL